MELGQYQLQIFVSLVVILGAAFVALICDFLKGNNEQLRELTIELKVRREEEHKRDLLMTPRPFEVAPLRQTVAAPEAPALVEGAASDRTSISTTAPPQAAEMHVADSRPAPSSGSRVSAARPRGEGKRPIAAEALAAMQRGAAMAASPIRIKTAFAKTTATAGDVPKTDAEPIERSVSVPEEIQIPSAVPTTEVHEPAVEFIPARAAQALASTNLATMPSRPKQNWSDLLARRAVGSRQDPRVATAAQTASPSAPAEIPVPAGFHDGYVLSRLVQSHNPVSGLVVSIGVSGTEENGQADPLAVRHLIQSLIGPQDFACASSPNEYLLIFPQERGVVAQRHLALIAQQLWDFQLNALGQASILFSWGGVEVRGESIEEAIASASERMQETRRGRSILAFETQALKKAV